MTKIWLSIVAVFGAIITVFISLVSIFKRGKKYGKQQAISEQNEKTLKEVKDASKIKNDISNMSDSDIDKWMRKNILKK